MKEEIKKILRVALIVGGLACAVACIYTSLVHEPGEETLEFSSEHEEITSDSLAYYMVFTGERADKVTWDFGDGTKVEATEVYKIYEKPGDYYVLCESTNDHGVRYSAYSLHITQSDYGLFDGYETQLFLLIAATLMLIASTFFRGERNEHSVVA